jgi:hypothetical protein
MTVQNTSSMAKSIIDGKKPLGPKRVLKQTKQRAIISKAFKKRNATSVFSTNAGLSVTVVCILNSDGEHSIEDVKRLKNAVASNTSVTHEFLCLTNVAIDQNTCQTTRFTNGYDRKWNKLELFRRGLVRTKYAIYLDLNTVVTGNIDDILQPVRNFTILRPWFKKPALSGLYSCGMIAWLADGSYSFIHDGFKQQGGYGNQGIRRYIPKIMERRGKKPSFFQEEFKGLYSYKVSCRRGLPDNARLVFFHGHPRPQDVKEPWITESYKV